MIWNAEYLAPDERAEAVSRAFDEAQNHHQFRHYASAVDTLPLLLHQHGLGQTLAYLILRSDNRPNSPYTLVLQHLTRRLAQIYPIGGGDILAHITQADSAQYRRLAEEARAFTLALRQALKAEQAAGARQGGTGE